MNSSKIIINPFKHGEEIDKSRHVTGIHKWARSSPAIGTLMLALGWFTIPFEVILRRDFGQRWFTPVNFYLGLLLVFVVGLLQQAYATISDYIQTLLSFGHFIPAVTSNENPEIAPPSRTLEIIQAHMSEALGWFAVAYCTIGLYHLFKIKWRNQTSTQIHSYDDGTSRLRWPAFVLMWIINILSIPYMAIYFLFIPLKQRRGKPLPKLITNWEAFTDIFVEPAAVFICAHYTSQVVSVWLYISGFAILIHAHWKEMARKNKRLDFQDGKFEAEMMRQLKMEKEEKQVLNEKNIEK